MTDKELLQQALEWVEWFASDDHSVRPTSKARETAEAIKARLAQSEKEWVGLKDDDVNYCVDAIYKGFDMKPRNEIEIKYFERVIKFVEAKLKEKNT